MQKFYRTRFFWLMISVLIIVVDQWSKYLAKNYLTLGIPYPITPFFNLTLAYNRGVAFSFLSGSSLSHHLLLAAISFILALSLIIWLFKTPVQKHYRQLAVSLIIGGALGNFVDRAFIGYVTDFFDFHLGNWHYATFNIADCAVCIGVVLLLLEHWWGNKKGE